VSIKNHFKNYSLYLLILVVGCGTLVGNPEDESSKNDIDDTDPSALQTVTFNIADAPVDDAASVFITISSLDVRLEGGEWINIPLVLEQEIDLLRYQNGDSVKFAEIAKMAAGTYTETRLVLSEKAEPRLVLNDETSHILKIPGGETSGIKIKQPFTVEPGMPVDLTLDFDLRKSLKVSGSGDNLRYSLSPVLRLLKHGEYGHIEGEEADGKVVCIYPEGVQPDETDSCENAFNSAIVKDGKYKLPHLPKGKYKIQVFDQEGKAKPKSDDSGIEVEAVEYKQLKGQSGKPDHADKGKKNEAEPKGLANKD
jgi:hypothetical protein